MTLSNGEYFKDFKFLTWHGFYEFAWNDSIILIWQTYEHGCGYNIDNFKHLNGKWLDIKMVNSKGIMMKFDHYGSSK